MHKYTWSPPKIRRMQDCDFIDHRGATRHGFCAFIETHYRDDGSHYHIYAMRPHGAKRSLWVGDDSICTSHNTHSPTVSSD